MRRAIVIGLDGVPHPMLLRLASEGVMPRTAKILSDGILRRMESSIPAVSCVAWSTIITGANPGEHGTYGFTDLIPGTYRFRFPNFSDLKAKTLWEEEGKLRSVVINIPGTYPARNMNGVLISGFVAVDLERAVYPKSLLPGLMEMGYRIDVDAARGHSDREAFFRDLKETLDSRARAYRHLWDKEQWNLFFIVFTGTDRLCHFFYGACEDEGSPFRDVFLDYFRRVDGVMGEIFDRCGGDDSLLILSDHGFGPLLREVNVNFLLREKGFLNVVNPSPDSLDGVGDGSRAFAMDPGRIYVNLSGRYPRGCVRPADRERVADDIGAALGGMTLDGKRVVRRICRREEIYSGPYLDSAPDLVMLPERGFDFKARITASGASSKSAFTGTHTQEDAFLFVRCTDMGEGDILKRPWVGDVRALIQRGMR